MDDRWKEHAACRGKDSDMWCLEDATGRGRPGISPANEKAIRVCRTECPVPLACLNDAIDHGDQGVIRGGQVLRHPGIWATCLHCGHRYVLVTGAHSSTVKASGYCQRACRTAAWAARDIKPDHHHVRTTR